MLGTHGTTYTKRSVLMYDVIIITSRRGKAVVSAMTTRGFNWIENNMTEGSPVTIDSESVEEIKSLIQSDGLTVEER